MNNSKKEQLTSLAKQEDAGKLEYEEMELLERLETLREDMEDLKATTLVELIQRPRTDLRQSALQAKDLRLRYLHK
jgi:hypothetical protein